MCQGRSESRGAAEVSEKRKKGRRVEDPGPGRAAWKGTVASLSNTTLPSAQPRSSSSPFLKPWLAGVGSRTCKRKKRKEGTRVWCAAGFPGGSALCAWTVATRPGAGRSRCPWISTLVPSVVSSSARKLGMRALPGAQGCPPLLCLLFPKRRWGGGLAAASGRLARSITRVPNLTPARQRELPSDGENRKVGVLDA